MFLTNVSPHSLQLIGWFLNDVSIDSKWIKNHCMTSKFFQYLIRFSSTDISELSQKNAIFCKEQNGLVKTSSSVKIQEKLN